jgi:K+-transporting ATPase ATPase C chain
MESLLASIRLTIATMAICVVGYAAVIWAIGQAVTPGTANASLITREDGTVIGSRLVGQNFTRPEYFWPRPSSAGDGYDATSAAGSNKSPTSPDLTDRAREIVERYGATTENPVPAELAAASGGGLDPHITESGALYQAPRIAEARGVPLSDIENAIRAQVFSPGGFFTPDRLVNVLELNLALDAMTAIK